MVKAVPNTRKDSLFPHIESNVVKGTKIYTDMNPSYFCLEDEGYTHRYVSHSKGQYVIGKTTHTNNVEGFWFHLQKAIRGTHVFVSGKHLEKYAGEFSYRFNRRACPHVMISEMLATF